MLRRLAPYLGYFYMSLVGWTTRLRVHGEEHRLVLRGKNQRFIYALWHNRQVFFTFTHRDKGAAVLVSQSRDGDIVAKIMELSRIEAPRGSSSRGGAAAVRDMMGMVARGLDIGITPDGPKGPVYEVKQGVLFLAQKLGIPILPVTNAISRKLVLRRSWDHYQVPLPFSRSVVRYAPAIFVGPDDDLAEKTQEVKAALDEITRLADAQAEGSGPALLPLRSRAALALLDLAAPLAAVGMIAKFFFSPRRAALSRLPGELRERAGRLSSEQLGRLAGRSVLWVHAASAGEVGAVEPLLRRLRLAPSPPAIVVTSSSGAGRDKARGLSCVDLALMAPVDASFAVGHFLDLVRPYALLLVETELWPNMIAHCARRGIRVGLVNGRISERSFSRYSWISPVLRPILGEIERFAVQTELDARRFKRLGARAELVFVAGNMKHDRLPPASADSEAGNVLKAMGWESAPLFVAGSTHPMEEAEVIEAFLAAQRIFPTLKLVLAPRHIERAEDAAKTLSAQGVRFARWSQGIGEEPSDALLLDVIGKLGVFYGRARASFVGGTLVPVGGHNLLEPALASSPVLFGPHTEHAQDAAELLLGAGGGFRVGDSGALKERLIALIGDPAAGADCGRKAADAARGAQGAVERTFSRLESWLTAGKQEKPGKMV